MKTPDFGDRAYFGSSGIGPQTNIKGSGQSSSLLPQEIKVFPADKGLSELKAGLQKRSGEAKKRKQGKTLAAYLLTGILAIGGILMTLTGCGAGPKTLPYDQIKKGNYKAEISCHDPQIVLGEDETYYMTGSHQVIASSQDLNKWTYVANGNRMFDNIFDGDLPAFAYVGKNEDNGYSIWASSTFYNPVMKKYVMYFCTTSSYIKSNLTMAVSDTAGGPFTYTDTFLYSGFDQKSVDQTNLTEVLGKDADLSRYFRYGAYDNKAWPNCIDPAAFTDKDGNMWLVYGSWSGGIFLLKLDPKTGLPIHSDAGGQDPYYGYHLAGGGHHAVEGPYIEYDPDTDYYYLFASYGNLTREGGYQIREFRSKTPTGPYEDPQGHTLGDQEDYFNYGLKVMGNYTFPSLETAYMAPGGQSIFKDKDGRLNIVYHQRFDKGSEDHEPRIHRLYDNGEGWLLETPFERNGEEQETEDPEIGGTYYLLNHGTGVDSKISEAKETEFQNGAISGGMKGTYQAEKGSNRILLKIDGNTYHGVVVDSKDEAGNAVRTILVSGSNLTSIWAVQYLKS